VSVSGSALIAKETYYGTLKASGGLWLQLALSTDSWVSLELPSLDYTYSANATITADRVSSGAGSLSWHVSLQPLPELRVAPFVRALIPTETAYLRGRRYGWEHGVSSSLLFGEQWVLLASLSFPFFSTHNSGTWLNDYQVASAFEAVYRLAESWSVSAGSSVRLQPPHGEPLLHSVSARGGARLLLWDGGFLELAAELPFAGADRTDLFSSLHFGWTR